MDYIKVIGILEGGIGLCRENKFDHEIFSDTGTSISNICPGAKIINVIQNLEQESNYQYLFRIGCQFQPWVSTKRIAQLIEGFKSDE